VAATLAMIAMTTRGRGQGGLVARLCGGGVRDCEGVLSSPYARVGGVPAAAIGFAWLGALTMVTASAALSSPAQAAATLALVGVAYVAMLPGVAFFVAAQVRLRKLCTLCMAVHGVALINAAITIVVLARDGAPAAGTLIAPALLLVLMLGVLLGSTVPHVVRAGADAAREERLARLLAVPAITAAELMASEPVAIDPAIGTPIGEPSAPVQAIAFVHPLCPACGDVLAELTQLAARGAVRARIVIAPLRKFVAGDRPLCDALVGLGSALPWPAFLAILAEVKRHADRLAAGDPLEALAEVLGLDRATLIAAEVRGHARVEAARAIVDAVPAVFVAGRRMHAPIAHLTAWCDDEPTRLAITATPMHAAMIVTDASGVMATHGAASILPPANASTAARP